jgi:hypothetical protein
MTGMSATALRAGHFPAGFAVLSPKPSLPPAEAQFLLAAGYRLPLRPGDINAIAASSELWPQAGGAPAAQ